ncbi:MAG: hypothetical protein L3J35_05480 [Bacteroidales bacterium]|nr:hypothetical protein [Bacteroidales bacterium]
MKRLLLILILVIPIKMFGQLLYYPITEANINDKHKFYLEDNRETIWKIKMKKNVVHFIKDLPYNEIKSFTYIEKRVTPKEYLITEDYIYFPNDKSLLILDKKGKLVTNLVEPRVQLFDSTEYGEFSITTPGGKCKGNPGKGYFMEFCGDFLFYITGKKVICMDRNNFEIIQEYNFSDFRNIAKIPNYKYIFEAVEFKLEIQGKDLVE